MIANCAAALALVSLVATPLLSQCPDGTPPPCRGSRSARTALAPVGNTLAVLYFDNLSRDSADRVLTDGLTEEIIARLGEVQRLTVKARYAVRRLREVADLDPAVVGRQLGVAYLVTGSVQRSGSRLRVRAELARAASGNRVWGQQYERGDSDVLAIISDIAQNVTAGVAGSLLPAERASLSARPSRNRGASEHLLRGDVLMAQRTPVSVRRSIAEYEAATRLDPRLAPAWARMSVAYGILVQRGWTHDGRPADDSLGTRSVSAAARALALDSASSDAWMAEGYARMVGDPLEWRGAEAAFRRAAALEGRNAEAWHQLGDLLGGTGRDAEAREAYRVALAADPGRPVSLLALAAPLPAGEALAVCDSVLATDPAFYNAYMLRALARLRLGDTAGAIADRAALERSLPVGGEIGGMALAARLTLMIGDTAAGRARARELLAALPATGPVHVRIAGLLAGILYDVGEREAALDLLRRAPRGVPLWQHRHASAAWADDERVREVFAASSPAWASR